MVRRSGQQQQTRSRGEAKHDQHIKLQLKWEVNVEMICIKRTTNVDKLTRAACRDLSSYYKSQHLIITIFLFDYIWKWKCRLFFFNFIYFHIFFFTSNECTTDILRYYGKPNKQKNWDILQFYYYVTRVIRWSSACSHHLTTTTNFELIRSNVDR